VQTFQQRNEGKTLDEMHDELVRECEAENLRQANPCGLPGGFFRVEDLRGNFLRDDFYCPRCKIHVKGTNLQPQGVKHCGKVETPDAGFFAVIKSLGVKSYTFVDGRAQQCR
jgi:hypothetical protein